MRKGNDRINNQVYQQSADIWWTDGAPLNLLQSAVNPARVGYFRRMLRDQLRLPIANMTALEVGCGGGILCEEIAQMGFAKVTGVDPAQEALDTAKRHAERSQLQINYLFGSGEALPLPDASMDVVFCCDVLEHVSDLGMVLKEIARVLRPGGHFCYDTLNRTVVSKLVAIKIWQDWSAFAFMPKDLHVWDMFIKPAELNAALETAGFENLDTTGIAPSATPLAMLYRLWQMRRGKIGLREMGDKLGLRESSDMRILYAGLARRTSSVTS